MSDSRSNFESAHNSNSTIGDRPAVEDTLGFQPYVIAIAEFLTHPDTKPPLTISIEGAWGRGKSSFMKQLEAEIVQKYEDLEDEEFKQASWLKKFFLLFDFKQKTQIVWFNAWRHDKAESLWAAFALSFLEQISTNHRISDILPNFVGRLKLFCHRLNWREKPFKFIQTVAITSLVGSIIVAIPVVYLKVGVEGADKWSENVAERLEKLSEGNSQPNSESSNELLEGLIIIGGTGGAVAGIGKLLATLRNLIGDPKIDFTQYLKSPDYDSQVAFIEKFHEDFSKIVEAYAGKGRKVYVFVDDLDRCELGKSADLLQALNMMISNDPNLIFILGMDREKVAAAIAFKQQDVIPYLDSIARDSQESEPENHQLMKKLDYGYAFLEKFVQLSFSVPKPSENTLDIFLKEFSLNKLQDSQEKKLFLKPLVLFIGKKVNSVKIRAANFIKRQERQEQQETKTQDTPSTISETTERRELAIFPLIKKEPSLEEINKLVKIVAPFFDYNPRNLKQYLNALKLRSYITYYSIGVTKAESEKDLLTVEQLGKFVAIIVKYPRLLPRLEENHELLGQLETYARTQDETDNSNESNHSSNLTISDEPIKIAKDWVDNNPKLKKLLGDGDSLAKNKGIKKLLEVSSELEIDPRYFKLRQLLGEGKWEEADLETAEVMFQVAQREKLLNVDRSIEAFPCEDLRTIDRLWVEYSDGKFGFSVQKKIYERLGGTREYNKEVSREFTKEVGWGLPVPGWVDGHYPSIITLQTFFDST